ncbi:MAG: nuclear transport factor 2 family protein [Vicinamibacteria bacterium]|nr:nuclear transport factor 2 family protein [Vicinamibacteria bacterium]
MRKLAGLVPGCIAALLLTSIASLASAGGGYAEDRALIEDLQARYMFALDHDDADAYAATFSADGVLDFGAGEVRGRKAIRDLIARMAREAEEKAAKDASELRPAVGRHNITNIAVKVDGDRAVGRAYWFHVGNDNPQRSADLDSFGHYEDEMVKVDGQWLFGKRKIYNEQVAEWAAKGRNPCW